MRKDLTFDSKLSDIGIVLYGLVISFGKFVKFYVKKTHGSESQPTELRPNAFQMLMSSQARINSSARYPPSVSNPRNKKDELNNAVIAFFKRENATFTSSEVKHGIATTTVKTLTEILWYIDGHHHTLAERSCDIPVTFKEFTNYNRPDLHRHRKRSSVPLSGTVLHIQVC